MATAAEIEVLDESTDLIAMATVNPLAIFTDREQYSQFYQKLKAETDKHVPDTSTERGRAATKSLAFKVTKAKTKLDKLALGLTEEWRQKTNAVNAARREMVTELEQLAAEVRRPVTEWEKAEEDRVAACGATIEFLKCAALVSPSDTSADIARVIAEVEAEAIDEAVFKELAPAAELVRAQTLKTLRADLERAQLAESERAELERLRAEAAERERQEQERREAEEAARARVAAEQAEAERAARAEAEEKARIEAAAKAAEDTARQEAEQKAEAEREATERAHAEELAAERARAAAAEREAYARSIMQHIVDCGRGFIGGKQYPYIILIRELEEKIVIDSSFGGLEQEARELLASTLASVKEAFAKEQLAAEERAKQTQREADQEHRTKIKTAAKKAIMTCGVSEDAAKAVVIAIVAGEIPHVSIAF